MWTTSESFVSFYVLVILLLMLMVILVLLVDSGIVTNCNHPDYPQRPRVDHLSESDKHEALANWKRQCKQFTDSKRKCLMKAAERVLD